MRARPLLWNDVEYISSEVQAECVSEDIQIKIAEMLNGEYNNDDVKKLKNNGHNRLRRFKTNKKQRIFYTERVDAEGKRLMLILGLMKNHRYNRAQQMQDRWVDTQLARLPSSANQEIPSLDDDSNYEEDEELAPAPSISSSSSSSSTKPRRAPKFYLYRGELITLDLAQERVLQAKYPMAFSGAPGTGKSCISLLLLAQEYAKLKRKTAAEVAEIKPLVYIARSKILVEQMKATWENLKDKDPDFHYPEVKFLTYEEMLQENLPADAPPLRFVGAAHFKEWFKDKLDKWPNLKKTYSKLKPNAKPLYLDKLYQELLVCSSTRSIEEYKNLGKNQVLFQDDGVQTSVYEAFIDYKQSLNDSQSSEHAHKTLNSALANWEDLSNLGVQAEAKYSKMYVDEAQDLSSLNHSILFNLAEDHNIAYCYDTHQSLNSPVSMLHNLKNLFHEVGAHENFFDLPAAYRCPTYILDLMQTLVDLKYKVSGGKSNKTEWKTVTSANPERGTVHWMQAGFAKRDADKKDTLDAAALQKLIEHYQNVNSEHVELAIVAPEEFKSEAKERFPGISVFTPQEIKGLEYQLVLGYRLLDSNEELKYANTQLRDNPDAVPSSSRPKEGKKDEVAITAFNKLLTSLSRATRALVMIQDFQRDTDLISTALYEKVLQHQTQEKMTSPSPATIEKSAAQSVRKYENECYNLILNENREQAEEIYNIYLKGNIPEVNFSLFSERLLAERTVEKPKANSKPLGQPATAKPPVQVTEVQEKFAKGLFKKTSTFAMGLFKKTSKIEDPMQLFEQLFKSTPENINAILFKVPVNGQPNLLSAILLADSGALSFYIQISLLKISNCMKLDPQLLYTCLSQLVGGVSIFQRLTATTSPADCFRLTTNLVKAIPGFAELLKAEDLCFANAGTLSLLEICLSSQEGWEILELIFDRNYELVKSLDPLVFIKAMEESIIEEMKTPKPRFMQKYKAVHPDFLKVAHDYCNSQLPSDSEPNSSLPDQNRSELINESGPRRVPVEIAEEKRTLQLEVILQQIFSCIDNKELNNKMFCEEKPQAHSAFYGLFKFDFKNFTKLLQDPKRLARLDGKLLAEDLRKVYCQNSSVTSNGLFYLFCDPDPRKLLINNLIMHTTLAKELTMMDLIGKPGEGQHGASVLKKLIDPAAANNGGNLILLNNILIANPKLMQVITPKVIVMSFHAELLNVGPNSHEFIRTWLEADRDNNGKLCDLLDSEPNNPLFSTIANVIQKYYLPFASRPQSSLAGMFTPAASASPASSSSSAHAPRSKKPHK